MDYDGNDFRQEKKISYIDAVTPQLKLSQDDSSPVPVCKGMIALKAETMLARLRLLYCHGDDDYFELSQPQAKELEALGKRTSCSKNQWMRHRPMGWPRRCGRGLEVF